MTGSETVRPDKEIAKLAAPAILSNITVPLLGLCDTTIAGHLGDISALGAIAVGSMMVNVVLWLMGFLRMGTTGLTATMYGAQSGRGVRRVLVQSLYVALAISVLVLALQYPLREGLLRLLAPEGDAAVGASTYFNICVWGIPAQLTVLAMTGWFIGMQNTVVPMAVAIRVNVLNIGLSVILAISMGLGIAGIALGTAISNWVSALALAIVILIWVRGRTGTYRQLREITDTREMEMERRTLRIGNLFKVNGDLFLRSACLLAVSLAMTAYGSRLGELTLGVNAVMMQYFLFFSYFMDGFAYAGEALAGRCNGNGDIPRLRLYVHALLRWGIWMSVIFFAIYASLSGWVTDLITDVEAIRKGVGEMRMWVMLLPPVTVWAFLFDGVYVGLTDTRKMLWATLAGAAAFFMIANIPGSGPADGPDGQNWMLWLGFETYLLFRGGILALNYVNHFGMRRNMK